MSQFPTDPPPSEARQYASVRPAMPGRSKAIASLVLGFCGLLMWACPLIGLAVAIPSLVLGIQARRAGQRGMADATDHQRSGEAAVGGGGLRWSGQAEFNKSKWFNFELVFFLRLPCL